MPRDVTLALTIPRELADRLSSAANEVGTTPEVLAVHCIEQDLDVATRHAALVDRLEGVDAALLDLAEFIGKATASSEGFDPSSICRYRAGGESEIAQGDEGAQK